MLRNRKFFGSLAALIAVVVIIYGISYLASLKKLTVTYKNANNVEIFKTSALDSGKMPKPSARITHSGQTVRLVKGTYTVKYSGDEGYQSLYQEVDVKESENFVVIKPSYADEKLSQMLNEELGAIKSSIAKQYPRIGLYQINQGKLFDNGDWYGTTLTYKGEDIFNNDTLRIVLHKEQGEWVVATSPPDISLSKFVYTDVPKEILDKVNELK